MSETMQALVLERPGGPEVLEVRDIPRPRISASTDILVRVVAAGINPADWQNRKSGGVHGEPSSDPYVILGIDGVGIVEEVGSAISHLTPGDAVWYVDGGYAGNFGSYAQFKVLNGNYAAKAPSSISLVEAAALPTVALTAWEAVFDKGHVQRDHHVLVHGGAGGLGHIAIQYLTMTGARIATTVSNDTKAEFVRGLGAELAINYRREDVAQALRKWRGKPGADVVFDFVGHANFAESFRHTAEYGRLVNTVVSYWPTGSNAHAEFMNMDISFVNIGLPQITANEAQRLRQTRILAQVARMVDAGDLRPHVDRVVQFDGVAAAQVALEAGETLGRPVLAIESLAKVAI